MSWLDLIPKWLLLAVAVALGAGAAVQTTRLAATKHTLADLRESVLKAKEARQEQAEAQHEIERLRTRAIAKETDRAFSQADQARRDRDRLAAAVAAERLRHAARVPAGEDRRDPTAAESRPPTAGAGLVLTDLLSGTGERLRSCAAALDESRIAGQFCERAYDAIAGPP